MNRMIGRRNGGLIDAVRGADLGDGRQERLQGLVRQYETAVRDGRDIDAEMADAAIDALLDEGRAAREVGTREQQNVGRQEATLPVSFDGGVRRGPVGTRRRPGMREESAAQLFSRAMTQSRIEGQNSLRVPPAA